MRESPRPGEWNKPSISKDGYAYISRTIGGKREKVLEHRKLFSDRLGRPLFADEEVHHKNGNRSDNRISNLELWSTKQPKGQRVEDKVEWALEILGRYSPSSLTSVAGPV